MVKYIFYKYYLTYTSLKILERIQQTRTRAAKGEGEEASEDWREAWAWERFTCTSVEREKNINMLNF